MPIDYINDLSKNAKGGTELQAIELEKRLPPDLLDKFQIIPSRVTELDYSRKRIYWAHDLSQDPAAKHLAGGGYNRFDKLVFVSNWQMQSYIQEYGIPWYKCVVIQNAVEPLELRTRSEGDEVRIIYHTTPHRGLNILLGAFDAIAREDKNVRLQVYSSFKIYGWEQRDAQYQALFDFCREHDQIDYFGSVPNDEVKRAISGCDIFAYPSTWLETSCISLIEAMSAGLLCIHPNYGALYETAANWTWMYQYQDDERDHLNVMYSTLKSGIGAIRNGAVQNRLYNMKQYTDMYYNWSLRALQWEQLLRSML